MTPNSNGAWSTCSSPRACRPTRPSPFLTDGDDDVRDLPLYLNPESAHLLEGFHVTMRLTVMANMAESLRATR